MIDHETAAKKKADVARNHSQIDESGAVIGNDSKDAKSNPSDRSNRDGDDKGHSRIDESGAEIDKR